MVLRSVAFGVLLSFASVAQAQEDATQSPTPSDVMRRLRTFFGAEDALFLLRGLGPRSTPAFKSDLADSLMHEMLRADSSLPLQTRTRSARTAALALGLSGAADGRGVPFEGAAARLRIVALNGNPGQSASAMFWLSRFHDRQTAVRHLGEMLRLGDNRAYDATQLLLNGLGPEGVAEVRRALEAGELRDSAARGAAEATARLGWPTPAAVPRPEIAEPASDAGDTLPPISLITARLRETRTRWLPTEVLRDAGWHSSRRFKDELADSLLIEALALDELGFPTAVAMLAAEVLGQAGAADGPGRPFDGSALRLGAMAMSGNAGQAAAAMHLLSRFHDRGVAVRMMGDLATLPESRAQVAVQLLLWRLGGEGVAEVRRAFEAGEIRHLGANSAAAERATRGWLP